MRAALYKYVFVINLVDMSVWIELHVRLVKKVFTVNKMKARYLELSVNVNGIKLSWHKIT